MDGRGQQPGARPAGQVAEIKLPSVTEIVVTGVQRIIKSPKALSYVALWVFGLVCMLYASAPVSITEEMRADFDAKLLEASSIPGYEEAFEDLVRVQEELYQEKTLFWSFNSERSKIVYALQADEAVLQQAYTKLDREREELRRDAFQIVGLFSEMGVQEARQLFWDCLDKGKGFARRSTFYDMLFSVAMRRDEEMASFLMRIVLNFVINATFGMIGVVFAFMYYLWQMVFAYKASMFGGIAFFLIAGVAGLSMAALYMGVLYGTVAAGGYTIIKAGLEGQRLEGRGGRGARPQGQIQFGQQRPGQRQPYPGRPGQRAHFD